VKGISTLFAFGMAVCASLAASLALAQAMEPPPGGMVAAGEKPALLKDIGIDQKLDSALPLALSFRDESGRAVKLGDYFGKRPVVLALVYYNCPMLCTQVLNGLVASLNVMSLSAGTDFDVVAVSFDPRETPEMARAKKEAYLTRYKHPAAAEGWHFLTGREPEIRELAKAAGFRFRYDPRLDQFAHASAIFVATPDGRLARYFYGIEYAPRDLRLALVEASSGRIGTPVDQILLYCFHYDPASGKYGAAIVNIVRLAGAATIVLLASCLWMLSRHRARTLQGQGR
jgi:protein SCO1